MIEQLPLQGVRVVDMSTSYAGPTATMYLADLGADVIKVERPGGDDSRGWGPPFVGEVSAWFLSANRNKRSVVLDVRSSAGRACLEALIASADVFVENLNPGKLAELGLDPPALRERYPALVYCAFSGFGLDGPDAHLPGYDLIAQARSGMMSVTGAAGGSPQRMSTALCDIVAGMAGAIGILAALRRVAAGGPGELVDVSLLDTGLALMAPRISSYLAGEPEPAPSGSTDSVIAVYQAFETADRPIVVAVGSDAIWQRLCQVVDRPDLSADPALRTNPGRRDHRQRVVAALAEPLRQHTAAEWLKRFADARIPCASIAGLSDVVSDPQVEARGSIFALPLAQTGQQAATGETHAAPATPGETPQSHAYVVAPPWRFAETPAPRHSAPAAGAHTVEVLHEIGVSQEEIAVVLAAAAGGGSS